MKNILFIAALTLVCATSCDRKPTATLRTEADTLTYKVGMLNSQGMKMYLANQMGMDTTYMDEFYRGLITATRSGDDPKSNAYTVGLLMGQNFGSRFVEGLSLQMFGGDTTEVIDINTVLAGLIDALEGREKFNIDSTRRTINSDMRALAAHHLEAKYGANREAGEKFLAENKTKEGVVTTPSGLQYRVVEQGTGPVPVDSQVVYVCYEGRTIDGNIFDSSYRNNDSRPTEFRLRGLIQGFREALLMMPKGSKWEIYIPQELAYGEQETAGAQIMPFSALIFKVHLVDAVNPSENSLDREFGPYEW